MPSRSLADGPTQVRCDFSSLASGESAGSSQLRPFGRTVTSDAGAPEAAPSSTSGTAVVVTLMLSALRRQGQSPVQVVNDVLGVFYSDADAHDSRKHARLEQLLLGELGVSGRRRVDDEGLGIADVGQVRREVDRL